MMGVTLRMAATVARVWKIYKIQRDVRVDKGYDNVLLKISAYKA